ncbi:MAG: hypothetical protein ACRCX2_15715 [Paraclostridium sp.]
MNFKESVIEKIMQDASRYGITNDDSTMISNIGLTLSSLVANTDYQTNHSIITEREANLTTAQYMESLYKYATAHNVKIKGAVPATTEVVLRIPTSEVFKYGTKYINETTVTVPDNIEYYIGDYQYKTEAPIEIKITDRGTIRKVVAKYVDIPSDSSIVNPNIITQRGVFNGTEFILLKVKLIQMIKVTSDFVFTNEIYEKFDLELTDDIVDFRCYYYESEHSEPVELQPSLYYNRNYGNTIYYRFNASNKISIMHKAYVGGFKPKIGSTLKIIVNTTKGELANFKYDAQLIVIDSEAYTDIIFSAESIDNLSSGGYTYTFDTESLRREIIKANGTRYAIDTENDLDTMLLTLSDNQNIFKSIEFRNDIYRRFNIFVNLNIKHLGNVYSVPTNTYDVTTRLENMDQQTITVKHPNDPNQLIDYTAYSAFPYTHTVVATGITGDRSSHLKRNGDIGADEPYQYTIPHIVTYDAVNNFVKCYDTHSHVKYPTEFDFINESEQVEHHFILNRVEITKRWNENIKLGFRLRTDVIDKTLLHTYDEGTGEIIDNGLVLVSTKLKLWDGTFAYAKVKMINYIESVDNYEYMLEIKSNCIPVKDHIVVSELYEDNLCTIPKNNCYVNLSQNLKISIYTKNSILNEYVLSNDFLCDSRLLVDVTPRLILQSGRNISSADLHIYQVPVIERSFYAHSKMRDFVETELKNVYSVMDSVAPNIKSLFEIGLRFCNTYGISEFLTVGLAEIPLNQVSLKIKLNIRPKDVLYDISRLYRPIYDYISKIDFDNGEVFHLTNLCDYLLDLEKEYLIFIQPIEFTGYSPTDQHIQKNRRFLQPSDVIERTVLAVTYNPETDILNYDLDLNMV